MIVKRVIEILFRVCRDCVDLVLHVCEGIGCYVGRHSRGSLVHGVRYSVSDR